MTDHRPPPIRRHPISARHWADPSPPTPAWAFTDVVCADPELLRIEFDAIIAANFPPPGNEPRSQHPPRPAVGTTTAAPGPATHPCPAMIRDPAWTRPGPAPAAGPGNAARLTRSEPQDLIEPETR